MRKLLLFCCCFLITTIASPVFALTIDVYDNVDNLILLEDFENVAVGWQTSLPTAVGNFTAGGLPGTGATAYPGNDGPKFSIQDSGPWYGRDNTTPGGTNWLDSGDITELTLTLAPGLGSTINSLYFYMLDPSDCGATTIVNGIENTVIIDSYSFSGKSNAGKYLVGITWDLEKGETLSQITWSTNNHTNDGYGLDDFSTVAPVPEPATMMLFGIGLLGIAGVSRRHIKA